MKSLVAVTLVATASLLLCADERIAHAVDNPTVTGPIADNAGLRGHALWDSWYDLSDIGYMEEEYFISGTARSTPAGSPDASYTTRIIVTRPINAADFNGTVVFDWVNVTAQFENAVDTLEAHELLHRDGYAYVHVSAQSAGVCCTPLTPKIWDPIRYAQLSHPGDDYAFDMFSQIVQAVKFPSLAQGPDPMGGLPVDVAIAVGQSQSASRLDTYMRQWQPSEGVVDGFLIHGGGSKTYSPPPAAPMIHLLSDEEADSEDPTTTVNYTLWEIAGTAHSDFWIGSHQVYGQAPRSQADQPKQPASADDDLHVTAGNYGEQIHPNQGTCLIGGATMPMRFAASAAIHYLDRWVRTGTPPPQGARFELSAGTLARDQYDNALGGIRLPPVDVPAAHYESTVCVLGGITVPFTDAELAILYPTHADYLCQMQSRTNAAIAAGFLLPEDAADLMVRVAAANNRWLIDGVPNCDDSCGNGIIDGDESCDDANADNGDGCDAVCNVESCYACAGAPSICVPDLGASCDDGKACTTNDLCGLNALCSGTANAGGACEDGVLCTEMDTCNSDGDCVGGGPLSSCISPDVSGRASLSLRDLPPAQDKARDALIWKWTNGTATKAQFETPTSSTPYALCLYDGDDRLLMANDVPGGAGWSESGSGFRYSDSTLANDGIGRLFLRAGTGRAKISAKGKGANLEMTTLGSALVLPLRVQLTNGTTCWEAVYQDNVTKNTPQQFKARAQ